MSEFNSVSSSVLLNKYCNELSSEDKRQRKKALENIRKEIFVKDGIDSVVSSFDQVQIPIIRCFKDNSEAVRETAVRIVTEILKTIPEREAYISSLMPTISERISGDIMLENSEEVRLCLVILLSELILKYKNYLVHYLDDFINIFVKTLTDPYPKVKKESCDCAAELAKSIPQYFHMQSESLIPPLIQTLSHQQYRIRVAGINSIGAVVLYGNNKSVNDVCGPLAERLFDQHHAVRAAVANVVGTWLLELRDRYSYFHKLIPLMLTSLSEEIPEHRKEAEELWARVGHKFMQENETDLKDKMDYLPESLDHYPCKACRPNLGCRTLVQRELTNYLPAIALELEDWKDDVRVKSAQLLCVTIQHAESYVTQHLEKVLPVLSRACGDSDSRVSDNVVLAAEMIGYFVLPEVYCLLILPTVQDSTSAGPLQVLAAVLRTSRKTDLQPHLQKIADTISSETVCHSRQAQYQRQLHAVVSSLQAVSQEDLALVSQQLFTVVVSVLGLAADPLITLKSQELVKGLAQCNELTVQELYKRHTPALLEGLAATGHQWALHSPHRFVFEALLTNAGAAVGLNISQVLDMLETSLSQEDEPEAILQTLMAVSYVLTHSEETLAETQDLPAVIHHLCIRVLQPHLVWKAGRAAEALRTAAVSCVLVALDLLECPQDLADPLTPLLLALLEDSAVKTRQFSALALLSLVKSLRHTDSLTAQHISTIFPVVLKRLDDNSDRVRETAVHMLRQLFHPPFPPDYSVECSRPCIEALFDTMLLHLDDPQPAFQDIMLDALKEISATHPQLLKSRIQKENFRSKAKCEQLITYLDELHL